MTRILRCGVGPWWRAFRRECLTSLKQCALALSLPQRRPQQEVSRRGAGSKTKRSVALTHADKCRTSWTPHFGYRGAYAPRQQPTEAPSSSGTNAHCPRVRLKNRDTRGIQCIVGAIRSSTACIMRRGSAVGACEKTPQLTAEP